MGRVRPAPGWLGQIQPSFFILLFLFFVKKNSKIFVFNFTSFPHIFMSFWLISSNIFHVAKNTKSDIKILGFRQNFQKKTCFEKRKMFLCIRPSISKLKNHMMFFIKKKNNVLACILALITSLLESTEHWLKFQKQQKFHFVCLLVSGVRYYT